jgi:hypothetical protein
MIKCLRKNLTYVLIKPKQSAALSSVFQLYLVDAIRRVQENQGRLKLNGTNQLLVYADDINLLGEYIKSTKTQRCIVS